MTTILASPSPFKPGPHDRGRRLWAEVPRLPGCVAQADTLEALQANILLAIDDWLGDTSEKTEDEARRLAAIQGTEKLSDASYPQLYEYRPPVVWSESDGTSGAT